VEDLKREDLSPIVVNSVFISSTVRDLHAFRQFAVWIEQSRFGVKESFPEADWSSVAPEEIVAECRRRVLFADAFVLLLGPWAGWTPPGYTESITHLEFQWARSHFATLHQRIEKLAEKMNARHLLGLYSPRILVLARGRHYQRSDGTDDFEDLPSLQKEVDQTLAKLPKMEREKTGATLKRFHQEVFEAVGTHEATFSTFDFTARLGVEVLNTMQRWHEFSAECLRLLVT